VLAAQPDEIRVFLRRTSILERLCASLCHAVTATAGSAATLESIARSNFFLVPRNTKREWYRHHHLFGDLPPPIPFAALTWWSVATPLIELLLLAVGIPALARHGQRER